MVLGATIFVALFLYGCIRCITGGYFFQRARRRNTVITAITLALGAGIAIWIRDPFPIVSAAGIVPIFWMYQPRRGAKSAWRITPAQFQRVQPGTSPVLAQLMSGAVVIRLDSPIYRFTSWYYCRRLSRLAKAQPPRVVVFMSEICGRYLFVLRVAEQLRELGRHTQLIMVANGYCTNIGMELLGNVPLSNRLATPQTRFVLRSGRVRDHRLTPAEKSVGIGDFNRRQAERLMSMMPGLNRVDLEAIMTSGQSYWFDPEEAIELGIIAGIATSRPA